jgi:hypothetical protein
VFDVRISCSASDPAKKTARNNFAQFPLRILSTRTAFDR